MSVIEIQIVKEQGTNVCQKLADFMNTVGYRCRNYYPVLSGTHVRCRLKFDNLSNMANATKALYTIKTGDWDRKETLPVTIVSHPRVIPEIDVNILSKPKEYIIDLK